MWARSLSVIGIAAIACTAAAEQRWLDSTDQNLRTDGKVTAFPLPNANSGPTTIALAADGTVWFTEGTGNRIGRMKSDGTDLVEFPLPNADSSPRIIALGADGNMWFSEHTGNRMGRITPDGELAEFAIPTPESQPRAIALGADGNIWFGMFAAGKIGRVTPGGTITEFAVPTRTAGRARWRQVPTATFGFPSTGRARSAASRRAVSSPSSLCRGRTRDPATSPLARTATCGSSSSRAAPTGSKPTATASGGSRCWGR